MLRTAPETPLDRHATRLALQVLAAVEREGSAYLEEVHLLAPGEPTALRRAVSSRLVDLGLDGVDVRVAAGPTYSIAKCCFAPCRTT